MYHEIIFVDSEIIVLLLLLEPYGSSNYDCYYGNSRYSTVVATTTATARYGTTVPVLVAVRHIAGVAKVKTSDIPGAWSLSLCRTRRGRMATVSVNCGATSSDGTTSSVDLPVLPCPWLYGCPCVARDLSREPM